MRTTWTLALGAALLGLGWQTVFTPARAQDGAPPTRLAGRWEGQVTFAAGHRSRVALDVDRHADGAYVGTYTLTILGEEGAETVLVQREHDCVGWILT